jgi:hypothetical protein
MIDWGFWGVVVGIVAAVLAIVAIVVTIVLYFRAKATSVMVSATFDDSGFVQVIIRKKGVPAVHVRDVKLLQAGTNKTLTIKSRHPVGEFDLAGAGDTAYDCFCLLSDGSPKDGGIDVQVWLASTKKRAATATATRSALAIKLPDGVTLE